MKHCQILLLGLCLLISSLCHSGLYKWTDEKGQTHYSDKPPQNTAIPGSQTEDKNVDNSTDKIIYSKDSKKVSHALSNTNFSRIRTLLSQSRFKEITRILQQAQSLTESDIYQEQALFQAFTAFDLDDIKYEATFNQWVKSHPNSAEAFLARARFYYSLGWKSRGTKFKDETTSAQFEMMASYFLKSTLDINKAIELNNNSVIPYSLLIGIGQTQGDERAINSALKTALKISPASYYVRKYYMATLEPRWGGSLTAMDRFAITSQEFVSQNSNIKLLLGASLSEAAYAQYRIDNYGVADKLFAKALSFGESADIYFLQGKSLYYQKKYTQAINTFSRAIDLYNTAPHFYYWKAKSYLKLKEYKNTHKAINLALSLNPTDGRINKFNQSFIKEMKKLRSNDIDKYNANRDIVTLSSKLKKSPDNAKLHYQKAMAQITLNQYDLAYQHLQQAITLEPDEFEYYRVIDYVLLKQGNLKKILTYWDKYLKINPNDHRAYSERGGCYTHLKELDLAIADFKKAADLGDKDAKSTYEDLLTIKASGTDKW